MSYRIIQASEIVEYVYCRRAWWLRRMAGREPHNAEVLSRGTQHHEIHRAAVGRADTTRRLALLFLFIAISILVFWLVK